MLWVMNGTTKEVWYQAEVVSVKARTKDYVVCNLRYTEDGDYENGQVLFEKDFGELWEYNKPTVSPFQTANIENDIFARLEDIEKSIYAIKTMLRASC